MSDIPTQDLIDFNHLIVALTRSIADLQSTCTTLGSKVDQLSRLVDTNDVSYRLVRESRRPNGLQSFGVGGYPPGPQGQY